MHRMHQAADQDGKLVIREKDQGVMCQSQVRFSLKGVVGLTILDQDAIRW